MALQQTSAHHHEAGLSSVRPQATELEQSIVQQHLVVGLDVVGESGIGGRDLARLRGAFERDHDFFPDVQLDGLLEVANPYLRPWRSIRIAPRLLGFLGCVPDPLDDLSMLRPGAMGHVHARHVHSRGDEVATTSPEELAGPNVHTNFVLSIASQPHRGAPSPRGSWLAPSSASPEGTVN